MPITIVFGSLGASIDVIGAYLIARSFVTAKPWHIAKGASQCWGYHPYILDERCRQTADAKTGALFMILGFILNLFAWYASWLFNEVAVKVNFCIGLIIFIILPLIIGNICATKLSNSLYSKYYDEANRLIKKE